MANLLVAMDKSHVKALIVLENNFFVFLQKRIILKKKVIFYNNEILNSNSFNTFDIVKLKK